MGTGSERLRLAGSFRDPAGTVFLAEGRVFRTIEELKLDDYQLLRSSCMLEKLSASGMLIGTCPITAAELPAGLANGLPQRPRLWVEHERVPFISYPYEWSFGLLQRAALHYLDLFLELLQSNFSLSDASAYNVQFRGTQPVFIDILSIRPYQEGEYWAGYRQFCEQFLNPLLLTSVLGVSHNSWLRGSP